MSSPPGHSHSHTATLETNKNMELLWVYAEKLARRCHINIESAGLKHIKMLTLGSFQNKGTSLTQINAIQLFYQM